MRRLIRSSVPLLAYVSHNLRRRMGKPSPGSFYTQAFLVNRRTANEVAHTPYLQSMHAGTLDPLDYGCLTVQDAHYCYCAQETLRGLLARIDREAQPELFELVESKARGYEDYNRTFLEGWHIRDAQSVIATEAMGSYVAHEQRVAREEDSIYTLVAYLPCYHPWPWFARQLMMSPRYHPEVYRGWFEGVYQGERESFGGAWLLGGFIEEWRGAGKPFDEDLALDIYRQSMGFELKVFSEACTDA